jgi:rRNA-processing protein EBP2
MAKDRKLKAALDRQKGVDYKLEHQKKQQKQAEKKKRPKKGEQDDDGLAIDVVGSDADEDAEERIRAEVAQQLARENIAADAAEELDAVDGEVEGWETDESEDAEDEEDGGVDLNGLEDESDSDSEDEEVQINGGAERSGMNGDAQNGEEAEEDIPLSDIESLASEDKGDVIPHQRLTINNTAALLRSLKSFALPSTLPFSATQSVTSTEPVQIKDVEDDLSRELAFYKQSLDAVKEGRERLRKEGVPFARPADYFAEMVKSEEQMGKVRQKMVDEAARKKASSDARRQRDLKKFGKAVQVAKLQERDKAKRDTLDKINVLKRSMSLLLDIAMTLSLTQCRTTRGRPQDE